MDLGFVYIDFGPLATILTQSPVKIFFDLFFLFGWLFLVYALLFIMKEMWIEYQEDKYTADWKWVLLAIDIPQANVQSPLAVEQLFAHLVGALDVPGVRDLFMSGHKQRWFSFEIVSIEGYIQFLIRTEETLRDLVEAAMYAQYPDAEITEVEDYVEAIPDAFPNNEYDVWAADFVTAEHDALPIRTYPMFEHRMSKDDPLKDPMGTFLESFSRIGPGEQIWFQIMVQPITNSWKEKSIEKIKEMLGEKVEKKSPLAFLSSNALSKEISHSLDEIRAQVTGSERGVGGDAEESPAENKLALLTPGQQKLLESMEDKISKLGMKTKMRGVYLGRKEVFRPSRAVNALIGAINQFNSPTANSIVPAKSTSAPNPKKSNALKELFMKSYKKRKIKLTDVKGADPFVLNIEELATVWHFPMSHVATPLLQKTMLKTSEPPPSLPVEQTIAPVDTSSVPIVDEDGNTVEHGYKTDAGHIVPGEGQKFG